MSAFESPFQNASITSALDRKIILHVGEQHFVTTRETLTHQSGFFSSLLSGRWSDVQPDGSYFIDADANLFGHILRYLRRGVLPVFYDSTKGHDHSLYLQVLEEAKYFQIPRLVEWLENKEYLRAVRIIHSDEKREGASDVTETIEGADTEIEYHPVWKTQKVYVCPRGIGRHRGHPEACGRKCRGAQGDEEAKYEDEEVLRMLVVRKETIFDRNICVRGR
ncbi:hypothetical protein GP486_000879 [Trichoglossum hirsutum]|uniref:BTB domain-containing protein n=1 Tax=Trichoglossum hirsutum TaxID=265104 RepID=A0A9P8LHY1_9PEZI|nr:hypothetical protein GP486_000879 [Trichoglossum hirsutum]